MNAPQLPIAIIGAGVAGLAAARALAKAGCAATVFDKGRSVGGRLATRRVETTAGPAQFDHGAQYITARDPAFAELLEAHAAPWSGQFAPPAGEARFVGAPVMNAFAKALAVGLDVRPSVEARRLARDGGGWRLEALGGDTFGPFAAVLLCAPAPQALQVLAPVAPRLAEECAAARYAPCWAAMAVFDRRVDAPGDGVKLAGGPLSWAAREASKPGRPPLDAWTLHADPDWSRAHLERAPEEVARDLLAAFTDRPAIHLAAHRWRYALVEQAVGTPFAWDASMGLGLGGDWRLGPRVELAWRSGAELGAIVAATFCADGTYRG